ncbi:MAG: sulfite exporter TauE/SafE family protein [Ectothiorhodospiraceae bacterium]|nr:sulfite exporter TauE/SafE family protein [Ectothiorhodospiraceae bacterium]
MIDPWLWLGLFILLAYTVEAMTGFGSIVIALSLGALLLPIPELLPVLVPLNIVLTGYLCLRHRRHIHRATLLKLILPLMTAGTVVGYFARPALGNNLLQTLFGLLVLWFAARELWRLWRARPARVHGPLAARGLTFGAGITHGLFASGGPLLVYALAGSPLPKAQLRATLLTVWFSLNSLLTLVYLADGSLLPALPRVATYLPVVLAGIVIGEWLHRRIDEVRFRQLVFALLGVTGLSLALPL